MVFMPSDESRIMAVGGTRHGIPPFRSLAVGPTTTAQSVRPTGLQRGGAVD